MLPTIWYTLFTAHFNIPVVNITKSPTTVDQILLRVTVTYPQLYPGISTKFGVPTSAVRDTTVFVDLRAPVTPLPA